MKNISVITSKLSKLLPIISLVAGSSSQAISQKTSLEAQRTLELWMWWLNPTSDKSPERKALDSIYLELKPCLEEFYTPKTDHPENVAKLCSKTQESLNNVFIIRIRMPDKWSCRGSLISIDTFITDRVIIQNTLVHELFHLNRREQLEQNVKAYRKLPIEHMFHSYFVKSASSQAKRRREYAWVRFDTINPIPVCDGTGDDRANDENRDAFISYSHEEVDKINRETYELSENHPEFIKQIAKDATKFWIYITLPEELYARARNLETFLLRFYWIPKEEITEKDIRILADDIRFDEKEFIMLLDGFETEFLEYLNAIEPR